MDVFINAIAADELLLRVFLQHNIPPIATVEGVAH